MPDLSKNIKVRLFSQDSLPEISPKLVVHFISHIQAPSIDIKLFNPVGRNAQQIVLHLRIGRIELGHIAGKSKGMIRELSWIPKLILGHWEVLNMEPVFVNGIFTIFENTLPLWRFVPNMVENSVQHDLHASLMGLVHQLTESFLISKMTVNFEIIRRIILVIAWGFKNRTEIKSCNPQILQVIQMVNNTL